MHPHIAHGSPPGQWAKYTNINSAAVRIALLFDQVKAVEIKDVKKTGSHISREGRGGHLDATTETFY